MHIITTDGMIYIKVSTQDTLFLNDMGTNVTLFGFLVVCAMITSIFNLTFSTI